MNAQDLAGADTNTIAQAILEMPAEEVYKLLLSYDLPDQTPFFVARMDFVATRLVLNRRQEALAILQRALEHKYQNTALIDRFAGAWFYAQYAYQIYDRDVILDQCDRLQKDHGLLPSVLMYKGAVHLRENDRAAAFAHYHWGASLAHSDHGLPRMYVGANSIDSLRRPDYWHQPAPVSPAGVMDQVTWIRKPVACQEMCVFAAGDDRYFTRFAPRLVKSLRETGYTGHVHFHVVNWNEQCELALAQCGDQVSVTTEIYRYVRDITFFATARFNRLAEIMKAIDLPFYIIDLDLHFTKKPVLDILQRFDLGCRIPAQERWFPWWDPTAKYVFVNNTEAGKRVADLMHNFFMHRFTPNAPARTWWFDQLMLNEVIEAVKDKDVTIGTLGPSVTFAYDLPKEQVEDKRAFKK